MRENASFIHRDAQWSPAHAFAAARADLYRSSSCTQASSAGGAPAWEQRQKTGQRQMRVDIAAERMPVDRTLWPGRCQGVG